MLPPADHENRCAAPVYPSQQSGLTRARRMTVNGQTQTSMLEELTWDCQMYFLPSRHKDSSSCSCRPFYSALLWDQPVLVPITIILLVARQHYKLFEHYHIQRMETKFCYATTVVENIELARGYLQPGIHAHRLGPSNHPRPSQRFEGQFHVLR